MDGRAIDGATDSGRETRLRAGSGMRRNVRGALRDMTASGVPDRASALTFYAALCVLAGLAGLCGLGGLIGSEPQTSDAVLDVIRTVGGTSLADDLRGPVEDLFADKQLAMLLLVGGTAALVALSSLYLRSFRLAAEPLTHDQGRLLPARGQLRMLARVFLAELIVVTGLCAIATGSLAHAIGDVAGVSDDAVVVWDIVKWPLLLLISFAAFAALQRSAFSDPRVLASSTVGSSQVLAALAWAFALTGFALYLASFGTFEDTYGTIGSGIVLLVWLTMFSMLYYVTPNLRVTGIAALGAGAALSAVTWLLVNTALAVCIANFDSLGDTGGTVLTTAVFIGGLWVSNVVVLLGVRVNALSIARATGEEDLVPDVSPTPVHIHDEALVQAVSRALRNDVAHGQMLTPLAADAEEAAHMSDLELDLGDWGFTYGVAWAEARAQDPLEPDESVAARALAAARQVFRLYCGEDGWEERVQSEVSRRRRIGDTAIAGNGHGGFKLQR